MDLEKSIEQIRKEIDAFSINSIEELERSIVSSENRQESLQQELQKQQLDAQRQQLAMQQELQEKEWAHEKELQSQKDEAAYEREIVRAMGFSFDKDVNDNQIPDVLEIEKFKMDASLKSRKLDIEEKKLKQDKEIKEKQLKAKSSVSAK